ncbi:Bacterial type II/III secretion system short domain protein [Roseimaritima multifibrata]|uniref:Bacterial type II/III secretion system short domain protein n=2 Tax=Roseimaritima multifibrata TaxID=1930274 RepID=A0A517MBT9_9BACT|nr:Bacterial type II/III secretion system short domain protein [Roseimaritima multifibrata]
MTPMNRSQSARFGLALTSWAILTALSISPAVAQVPENTTPENTTPEVATPEVADSEVPAPEVAESTDGELRFAFNATPWREVIQWVAEEAGLALHVNELPTGSFTYSDPNAFSPGGAIDRLNLFLLPEGFALVRSGDLLSLIHLTDSRSMQQLDALAETVSREQLPELDRRTVAKCLFSLGELDSESVVQELSGLQLMSPPKVFSQTNQLMITDTVQKLQSVEAILAAFKPAPMEAAVVKDFALQHVNAEDILVVARPHLGLATGEMIGIDVSVSTDLQGKNLFVTGVEDKVMLVERLVKAIDQPEQNVGVRDETAFLKSYPVDGGNVEIVYDVLQTMLAGESVRLSMDRDADSVVALATPAVQDQIAATVTQLQASQAEFEVIPLKNVDPYLAISLLKQMLDLPDPLDDPDDSDKDVPKIDADPANRRLFVRAKASQLQQIKQIVTGLDSSATTGSESDEHLRVLALSNRQAEQTLQTVAQFWRAKNPIILFETTGASEAEATERVIADATDEAQESSAVADNLSVSAAKPPWTASTEPAVPRLLNPTNDTSMAPVHCQVTPRGLLLQSEDTNALNRIEELVLTISGPMETEASPPIVFYLKYTKAADAIRMLAELLDGGESAKETETSSLVNGYVSSGFDSYLGSIVTSREGTVTMMAGSITVVADPRLNRLIAQGTTPDIELIQSYLQVIDKDNSLTSIETYGRSHVIELANTSATEVAKVIREAFPGRLRDAGQGAGANSGGANPQDAKATAAAAAAAKKQNGNKTPAAAKATDRDLEPMMTLAVHQPSNSLIVTAPEALYEEVKALVERVDTRGEQSIQVVTPVNVLAVEAALQELLTGEAPSDRRRSNQRSSDNNRR